ncbi:MAG: hypothetical protein ACK5YR_25010 [Pirellula sp.]|jgi:hypothetical protein
MSNESNSAQSDQPAHGQASFAKSIASWFLFSFAVASVLVILQSLAKLPERIGMPDAHWLFGRQSGVNYIAIRMMLILVVSIIVSVFAAISRGKPQIKN